MNLRIGVFASYLHPSPARGARQQYPHVTPRHPCPSRYLTSLPPFLPSAHSQPLSLSLSLSLSLVHSLYASQHCCYMHQIYIYIHVKRPNQPYSTCSFISIFSLFCKVRRVSKREGVVAVRCVCVYVCVCVCV